MLPKHLKIGDRLRVEYVLKKGHRLSGRSFQFRFLPKEPELAVSPFHSFAVIASKKICPTAVSRNRVRRRIFAAIRKALNSASSAKPWYDIVVLANQRAVKAPYKELELDAAYLMHKL